MSTDSLSRSEIENACRTLAVRTLGIDPEGVKQAATDAADCRAALQVCADSAEAGLALLLRSIAQTLEIVQEQLDHTARTLGV